MLEQGAKWVSMLRWTNGSLQTVAWIFDAGIISEGNVALFHTFETIPRAVVYKWKRKTFWSVLVMFWLGRPMTAKVMEQVR